ncbi:MAG: ATP-binding cassette domain-containing protein [Alphaproteobacteria bacterium]|jgi:subfamily B ATP-binding cassette protein MsbA|nr:ATP-binding cassette domain-containing protein [Alphaproteobacteria bacterium]MBP7729565.1 ATP-binding cassette domain-containing protein [Alphaproteobacteria bacterium]
MKFLNLFSDKTSVSLVKRLWCEHIKPYRWYICAGLLCMAIAAMTTAMLAKMLQPLFDDVFVARNEDMLFQVALLVFGIFVLKGFSSFGEAVSLIYVGQKIIGDIQRRLFDHFIGADLAYFHARSSGELVSRVTNDVNLMRNAVTTALTGMGKDSLSLFFLIGLMFYQDWLLASLAFFIFPLALLPIVKIGQKMRKVSFNTQEEMSAFTILLHQVFQGMRIVKSYAMENYEQTRAHRLINSLSRLNIKGGRVRSASHPIMETLGGIAIVIVILYGGAQVIAGNRTTGTFISFITALLLAYEPLKRLANLNANLQEGLAAAWRVFQAIDLKPTVVNAPKAQHLKITKGQIIFNQVGFSYPNGKRALQNISLDILPTQRVALVGPSGSGKSTLLNLIPRFYDVTEGAILIDGIDLRKVTLDSLRSQIALVSQEVILFDDTVKANIAYGRLGSSEKDIFHAAKAAGAHDFIMQLPEGYDTLVGEQGIRLSGGQRQRLSIARAMLKNAPILLLDEATSSLDTESERHVQTALNRLMDGRTSVVVAHRLSTVIDADSIYVIEEGGVTEKGTHQQLLENNKTYARLVELQFASDTLSLAS